MGFNFDEVINRKNTASIKWDVATGNEVLPMWVADMDFKTAPAIINALKNRVGHGIFGYTQTPPEFYDAIMNWWDVWHSFAPKKDWIIPTPGVIPALSATIRALTQKGDKVLIQPPVYNHFYITLQNCGCTVVENNLLYKDGHYTIDFEDLDCKASDPEVKLFVMSNPHNPAGRVWTRDELQRIGEICLKHNVIVISDEIHSDLVYKGFKHIPFASISDACSINSVTCSSPSKTFNLAGLQVGYLFTENKNFIKSIQNMLTLQEMELLSPFAITALIAAYDEGTEWLEALKAHLYSNYLYVTDFVSENLPQFSVVPLQATYLVWVDCSSFNTTSAALAEKLLKEAGLWVNPGTMYGEVGEGFLRVNIACPRSLLHEGLKRLVKGLT